MGRSPSRAGSHLPAPAQPGRDNRKESEAFGLPSVSTQWMRSRRLGAENVRAGRADPRARGGAVLTSAVETVGRPSKPPKQAARTLPARQRFRGTTKLD